MYLWTVSNDDLGIYITIYDSDTREAIDITGIPKFPNIEVNSMIYGLRSDLEIKATEYEDLPEDFEQAVKNALTTLKVSALSKTIFDRVIHPALLENYNVPKTMGNLKDMGYTFH